MHSPPGKGELEGVWFQRTIRIYFWYGAIKLIEVNAAAGNIDTVASIAEHHEAADFLLGYKDDDGRQIMRFLIADESAQVVLDALQKSPGHDHAIAILESRWTSSFCATAGKYAKPQ